MSDTSGLSSRKALAFYDHHSSSWRTSQATFLSDSMSSSVTLPRSGMTRSGVLYERPMSERATPAPGSLLLPTPTTEPMTGNGHARHLGAEAKLLRTPQASVTEPKPGIKLSGRTPADPQVGLIDQITVLLPTPAAQESDPQEDYIEEMRDNFDPQARMYLPGRKWHSQRTLSRVAALPPTPTASDAKGPSPNHNGTTAEAIDRLLPTPAAWDGERGPDYARMGREDSGGDDLVTSVAKLLPTPSAADGMGGHERRGGRRGDELLLPGLAKEVSRGEPTDPPSPEPPSSPDDGPLTLWT